MNKRKLTVGFSAVVLLALTALALREEGIRILEAGCNTHVTKPVKKSTLLEILHVYKEHAIS